MSQQTHIDWAQGSAFVQKGTIYVSPNCKRVVIIPPAEVDVTNPFEQKATRAEPRRRDLDLEGVKQPVRWHDQYGWIAFIPLAPSFVSLPFNFLCWSPKILRNKPHKSPATYEMEWHSVKEWRQLDENITLLCEKIRLWCRVPGTPPPSPKSFGYDLRYSSEADAQRSFEATRNAFILWMGYLSYLVAQSRREIYSKHIKHDPKSPVPAWHERLRAEHPDISEVWLDGLYHSNVFSFNARTPRVGMVYELSSTHATRPPIEWLLEHHVPVYYPWRMREEEIFLTHKILNLELRPPRDLLAATLTDLFKSMDVSLAAAFARKFFNKSHSTEGLTMKLLGDEYSTTLVYSILSNDFAHNSEALDQHMSQPYEELERKLQKRDEEQRQLAIDSANLPTLRMIELANENHKLLTSVHDDWDAYWAARVEERRRILAKETPEARQARLNRENNPSVVRSKVFVWKTLVSTEGASVYMREHIATSRNSIEEAKLRPHRKVYNGVTDEWDLCRDLEPPAELAGASAMLDQRNQAQTRPARGQHRRGRGVRPAKQPRQHPKPAPAEEEWEGVPWYDTIEPDPDAPVASTSALPPARNPSPPPLPPNNPPVIEVPTPSSSRDRPRRAPTTPPRPTLGRRPRSRSPTPPEVATRSRPRARRSPESESRVQQSPPAVVEDFEMEEAGPSVEDENADVEMTTDAPATDVVQPQPITPDNDMVRCLRQSYGYLPGTTTTPCAAADWDELVETFGFTELLTPEVALDAQQQIKQFYLACIEPTSTEMPAALSDLNTHSLTSLSRLLDLSQIHRPHENLFVFSEPRSEEHEWMLGVETAEIALYVCRLRLEHSWARIDSLTKMLLERGVPCRTLMGIEMSGRCSTVQEPYTPRSVRPSAYKFGVDDFEAYRLQCENIIKHQQHGRAALLRGGLVGRIASEFLSVDDGLAGPSKEIIQNRQGFIVPAGDTTWCYCDDQLTENELSIICGTYTLYTATKGQITVKSWFPPPNLWQVPPSMNGSQWVEWTPANEAWYRERVEDIRTRQAQPLTRVQWKSILRGTPPSRKLLAAASQRAQAFVNGHVPVVPTYRVRPGL
ncbi:hypothetical protein JR316_0013484 [Psilocybe cubensis]|uniref:Uncharacterized protein n=2 Tax=Psilocybe cubensis TaxID=181762 RepID=A0ACB8GF95_PSICU|nr:uncharacterized protein JR316_0013484 [Psilocybe cubensis]KAH9474211.1 hypothetical protein JR316_0013484 [Psilocybe cubensis]